MSRGVIQIMGDREIMIPLVSGPPHWEARYVTGIRRSGFRMFIPQFVNGKLIAELDPDFRVYPVDGFDRWVFLAPGLNITQEFGSEREAKQFAETTYALLEATNET